MTVFRRLTILVFLVPAMACDGDQAQPSRADAAITPDAPPDAPDDIDDDGDGFSTDDCNDTDPLIHPGATEICNDVDDDCDNTTDEGGLASFTFGMTTMPVTDFAAGTEAAPVAYTPPGVGKLELCSGTYYANITVTDDVEIVGKATATTILHGGAKGTVVKVSGMGKTYSLSKLTISNGKPVAGAHGGGIACTNATLTATEVALTANDASGAQGGGAHLDNCTATFTQSTIENNVAGAGGGLYVDSGSVTLTGTRVAGNTAATSGGGVHVAMAGGNVQRLTVGGNSTITGNTSTGTQGGGIFVGASTTCTGSAVTANTGHGVVVSMGNYTSTTCDYGTDAASDNTPSDVLPEGSALGGSSFGNDASFSCTRLICN